MQVEKQIAFKIRDQFPALYREFGSELVDFVQEYYKFLETQTNQSVYNSRRLFEYRDVSTTLSELLIQFHKMFMADLPLLEDKDVRLVVKNVMDLYRRKGTPGGVLLFFRMFYGEDVEVKYPAKYMLKVSDSDWRTGNYLQCFPNDDDFSDIDGNKFTYKDVIGKNIRGSISNAKAAVDSIVFMLINKTLTPVIYISEVKGTFIKYDDLVANINGNEVAFGRLNGSAVALDIDEEYGGTTGNEVGDILSIKSDTGQGARAIVTELQDEYTGTITYEIIDGGFGYTEESTKLKVSSQTIIINNPDLAFIPGETLEDSGGNVGTVTGQSAFAVGVYFASNTEFFSNSTKNTIQAMDRAGTPYLRDVTGVGTGGDPDSISEPNTSSPGNLYAVTGDANNDVRVGITNIESVSLITDKIANFIEPDAQHPEGLASGPVYLNSSNYSAVPPAAAPMSGSDATPDINSRLDEAFDLTPFDIGTISQLININPGEEYSTDVWTLAVDEVMSAFDRYEQVVVLEEVSASMSIGDTISQGSLSGVITGISASDGYILARPYSYYGFDADSAITHKGSDYNVVYVARDYNSDKLGESAEIKSTTIFSSGRIKAANIYESGFGYNDGEYVSLVNDKNQVQAKAYLTADSQGLTSGYWSGFNSHLNGYRVKFENKEDKDLLPLEEFATEALRVAVGGSSITVGFDTWLESTASDGYAFGDMNKNGSISTADALAFNQLYAQVDGLNPDFTTRWNEVVAPSLREQDFFDDTEGKLWEYVDKLEYYDSLMKVQDSDYYQEYSYEVKGIVSRAAYEEPLRKTVHMAGAKLFDEFLFKRKMSLGPQAKGISHRFNQIIKLDTEVGGDPIVGPNQVVAGDGGGLTVDRSDFRVDNTEVSADMISVP